jgi:hypothetical protein
VKCVNITETKLTSDAILAHGSFMDAEGIGPLSEISMRGCCTAIGTAHVVAFAEIVVAAAPFQCVQTDETFAECLSGAVLHALRRCRALRRAKVRVGLGQGSSWTPERVNGRGQCHRRAQRPQSFAVVRHESRRAIPRTVDWRQFFNRGQARRMVLLLMIAESNALWWKRGSRRFLLLLLNGIRLCQLGSSFF